MEHVLKKIENCPILQEKTGLWRTEQNKNDLKQKTVRKRMLVELHIPNYVSNEKIRRFSEWKKPREQPSSTFTLQFRIFSSFQASRSLLRWILTANHIESDKYKNQETKYASNPNELISLITSSHANQSLFLTLLLSAKNITF